MGKKGKKKKKGDDELPTLGDEDTPAPKINSLIKYMKMEKYHDPQNAVFVKWHLGTTDAIWKHAKNCTVEVTKSGKLVCPEKVVAEKDKIWALGVVTNLLPLMFKMIEHADVQHHGLGIIWALVLHPEFRKPLMEERTGLHGASFTIVDYVLAAMRRVSLFYDRYTAVAVGGAAAAVAAASLRGLCNALLLLFHPFCSHLYLCLFLFLPPRHCLPLHTPLLFNSTPREAPPSRAVAVAPWAPPRTPAFPSAAAP